MSFSHRFTIALALAGLAACATPPDLPRAHVADSVPAAVSTRCDAAAARVLAPTGVLRVAAYEGSPTSMVRSPGTGERVGLTLALGERLARTLGVPSAVVAFRRPAEVVDGLRDGAADFTFTNASAARARLVDFSEPVLRLELGVIVPPGSPLRSPEAIDERDYRIGVSQGSSSQAALGARLVRARLVPVASLAEARTRLAGGELDAFATNKGILFELGDQLPGFTVLPGRWGLEHLAIAVPKGRDAARDCIARFADDSRASGFVQREATRAGLRGVASD